MDSASIPSIYRTAWTSTKFNLGFASAGTIINLMLLDSYEPVLAALPLVLGALFSAIVGLTRHRTIREIAAAAGLIIFSEAIVLLLQLSLADVLLGAPKSVHDTIYNAFPGLLLVYSLALIGIRLTMALHERLVGDQ